MTETGVAPPDALADIVRHKAVEVAARKAATPIAELRARCDGLPPARGFAAALQNRIAAGQAAVIAEAKRASPSRGVLRDPFDPAAIAASYAGGGATCLSVLTDEKYFLGADEYLRAARDVCALPVLRKDFIVDDYQIWESRVLNADCILLIAAVLGDDQLSAFSGLAAELGLDVLVEVHDNQELGRALSLDAPLLGINNRNLRTFETSIEVTLDMLPAIPDGHLVITESGILRREDVSRLRAAGVNAFLVGEAFMRAAEPGERLAELFF